MKKNTRKGLIKRMIKLYSTGCPKCKVLSQKLKDKNIDYELCTDINKILDLGFTTVPVLEVDNKMMDFKTAVDWVNKR